MQALKSFCEKANRQGFRNYLAYDKQAKSYYATQTARIRRILDTCKVIQISNNQGLVIEIAYFSPYLYALIWYNKTGFKMYYESFDNVCLLLKNAYLHKYNIRIA